MTAPCGSLLVGGFAGQTLSERFARALRAGQRGGAILFKRNLDGIPLQAAALTRSLRAAAPGPVVVGIDQEGGRVARLGAPLLEVPPMRAVAGWGDPLLAERIARGVGHELAALGFTIDFAPVLDVNTRADNPVIGDRAFGDDPAVCATFGAAWVRGLQSAGIMACGKHFPGHGDTSLDSHLALPIVDRSLDDLQRVDLAPFAAAAAAGVCAMMTAHVVYSAIDSKLPATFSRKACTGLRNGLGFEGVLFSDDLEMGAISERWSTGEAAILAVEAGCDALLVCADEDQQDEAYEELVREAESSPAFRSRCEQAAARLERARRRAPSGALDDADLGAVIGGVESRALAAEIAGRLGR